MRSTHSEMFYAAPVLPISNSYKACVAPNINNPKPMTTLRSAEATIEMCKANLDCAYSVEKQIN